ncbi:MAG: large repetitive protein [Chthoniobacter sp.]|jgi:hypothetical protein|nr:large repetitive protein [Chthoniobacter sp.]
MLSIADPVPITEGDTGTTNLIFVVTRSGDTGPAVTVDFQTVDGTAQAGVDYEFTSGTLSFAPNQATATIAVPITGDLTVEPDETFTVTLSKPQFVDPTLTFAAQATFATADEPRSVAVGDFNGDGRPDLAVANYGSDSVSVFLNQTAPGATAPSFATPTAFATGDEPQSVAVGDLNGDGRPDLVVANVGNAGNDTVSVLLNQTAPGATAPSFAAQATFAVASDPYTVAIGDLNGDGRLDIVTANPSNGNVSVLLNSPTAAFLPAQHISVGSLPTGLSIGEINGDGRPDLVVTLRGEDRVAVLLNQTGPGSGSAAFAVPQKFFTGSAPVDVSLGDVNGDGEFDVAVASRAQGTVSVHLNKTPPGAAAITFASPTPLAVGSNAFGVALGDVNGDGKADVVASNFGGNTVSVFANQTDPGAATATFAAGTTLTTGSKPAVVVLADINLDGTADLAVANSGTDTVSVLLNTTVLNPPQPSFGPQATFGAASPPFHVAAGDLNGDGRPDLVTPNASSGAVEVRLNQTAPGATVPSFASGATFASGGAYPVVAAIGDVNGDGRPDLVVANRDSNNVAVLLNQTAPGATAPSFAPARTFAVEMFPNFVTIGDVNGDGRPDLTVANEGTDRVSVLLNSAGTAGASLFTIDWNPDGSFDGRATGTLGTFPVTLTSTDGTSNGGSTFATNFPVNLGTNGVPGIGDPTVVNEAAAIDWNDGAAGTATIDFGGGVVRDPIVLINFTDPLVETFDFADSLTLVILDQNPAGTVTIAPGNVVTTNGGNSGSADNGFAVQILGSFSSITFATNVNLVTPRDSVGLSVAVRPGAFAASFGAQGAFSVGDGPRVVQLADVNGDGRADVVASNLNSTFVSVLLNQTAPGATAPSFGEQVTFATGRSGAVDVADVNGDGRPDLVVDNPYDATVSVLLNQTAPGATTPSFAAQATFGAAAGAVTIGDVNGDGRADVVLTDTSNSTVQTLLNQTAPGATAPSFAPSSTFGVGSMPRNAAIADFNGDGRPDLVTANRGSSNVSVLLSGPEPLILMDATAVGTITTDDFSPPTVQFSAATQSGSEGAGALTITVQLSNQFGQDISVPFVVAGSSTASDPADYTISASPVIIHAGQTTGTITLTLVGDTTAEPSETVAVTLGTPSAGMLGTQTTHTATILDDEPPTLSIGDASVAEGNSGTVDLVFPVTRLGDLGPALTVTYSTSNGTAIAGEDYTGVMAGTLLIPAGATTAEIRIPVLGDTRDETDETFTVTLTGAVGSSPGGPPPSFAAGATFATGTRPITLAQGDFNGDGRPDLAIANSNADSISVLLNQTAPGAAVASYAPQATFAVGDFPISVAVGDVNGDGLPDLVTANVGTDNVSVLINRTAPGATAPSFAAQATFASPDGPDDVAIGDLNGDGRPDLAVANRYSDSVSVLLNQTAPGATAPSFAAQATFAAGDRPETIATADFNGDGRADLAVGSLMSGNVSVFLNQTAPGATAASFAPQVTFAAVGAFSVAAGDLNGDGRPDLAVANLGADTVSVRLNQTAPGATTPSFAPAATFAAGPSAAVVEIGDVNGDFRPDLIVSNPAGIGTVSVLANQTDPGAAAPDFAAQATFAAGPNARLGPLADVNGDGRPDVAVVNYSSGFTATVLLNTTPVGSSTPGFGSQATFASPSRPHDLVTADLNGDGRPDLVNVNGYSNLIEVRLNQTAGGAAPPRFGAAVSFATPLFPIAAAIGDLNGDGLLDLAVANRDGLSVSVLLSQTAPGATAPSFAVQVAFLAGTRPGFVTIGDVNGDGRPDLAVGNYDSDDVSILLNQTAPGATAPSFAAPVAFPVGDNPAGLSLSDLNGDGRPDLVSANFLSDNVSVRLNQTAPGATAPSFGAQSTFAAGDGAFGLGVGDLNGDGRPDLAVTNSNSTTVSVLLNRTTPGAITPNFAPQTTIGVGANPSTVTIGDLDGDGRPDLAVSNRGSNTVSVLRNTTGSATATLHTVDWDPDGSLDGVARGTLGTYRVTLNSTDGANNGGGTFGTNFATNLGTDGVPGIGDPTVFAEAAAIDWNPGAAGTATIDFGGGVVQDPILLIAFTDPRVDTFDFGDGLTLVLLDQNPAGSVTIAPGNVVTTNGGNANSADDGFAVQLLGSFSSITFATNVNLVSPSDSVGISVATQSNIFAATFASQATFATGTDPRNVVVADFNGDFVPDLAVDNTAGDNNLGVLLGGTAVTILDGSATGTITDDDPTGIPVTLVNARTARFTDVDGDLVTVRVNIGRLEQSDFLLVPAGLGGQLYLINFSDDGTEFKNATLSISAEQVPGGNGMVNVGRIDAHGLDLGTVRVTGDLGQIDAGDTNLTTSGLLKLRVGSLGVRGDTQPPGIADPLHSEIAGRLGSLVAKGDVAGVLDVAGGTHGRIGQIQIRGDIDGGAGGAEAGLIRSTGNVGPVTVKGSMIGGANFSGLIAGGNLGPVLIGHDLMSADAMRPVLISALGNPGGSDQSQLTAIASVEVLGNVAGARILAGYAYVPGPLPALVGMNPDAGIHTIDVGGTWSASSVAAGVADATTDGFGRNDVLIAGDTTPNLFARIARITIKGPAIGSAGGTDHYGITAQRLLKLQTPAIVPTFSNTAPDDVLLDGTNKDFRAVDFA